MWDYIFIHEYKPILNSHIVVSMFIYIVNSMHNIYFSSR